MFLDHLVHLMAKAGGDNSMPEKREPLEGAEGAVPQDPCDRAKAALPESQSPAVQPHTRCYSVSNAALPGVTRSVLRAATSDWRGDGERLHPRG